MHMTERTGLAWWIQADFSGAVMLKWKSGHITTCAKPRMSCILGNDTILNEHTFRYHGAVEKGTVLVLSSVLPSASSDCGQGICISESLFSRVKMKS